MFGPNKSTPALAANRLSRWALFLRQFNYTIEYRKTSEHSNADVLSRLPVGEDPVFDQDESTDDVDTGKWNQLTRERCGKSRLEIQP